GAGRLPAGEAARAVRRPRDAADPVGGPAQGADPQGALALADSRLRCGADGRTRRAGAALPQPARLCPAHTLPGLRPSLRMPELLLLAGGAPLPPLPGLPSLRPCGAHAPC